MSPCSDIALIAATQAVWIVALGAVFPREAVRRAAVGAAAEMLGATQKSLEMRGVGLLILLGLPLTTRSERTALATPGERGQVAQAGWA